MKKPLLTLLCLSGIIFILPITVYSANPADSYSEDEPAQESLAEKNKILSVEVTNTSLRLILLGTLTSGGVSKAMIKNPVTGELGSYVRGDILDLVNSETVKVVEISNCAVLIERSGKFETMECRNKMPTVVFNKPSALSRYRIILPEGGSTKFIFSDEFTTDYDKDILNVSERHGVDPYLVKAVIKTESNFDPNAVSPKNAQGIMQLIPGTADDYGVSDPFDAKDNMEGGVQYLKDLLEYFDGDMSLSLAAYNAGKGAVIKHGFTIPPYPETTDYIAKVLGYYKLLKAKNYALKK
ncbi:MAG TPA: transglycosylase SLT domain-containing protein [Thermodesulfobacteriota bacterium]|nr:transglycosylase SLT domain-containing protein [Thermodesulfobacteriota bacterium]